MSLTIPSDHLCDQCKDVAPMISLSTCVVTANSAGSASAGQVSSLGHYHDNTALRGKARTWQSPNLESEGRGDDKM